MSRKDRENLVRRYLLWCYKTTKEDFDRIERYFTQFEVDNALLENLKAQKKSLDKKYQKGFQKNIDEFKKYMNQKKQAANKKKFSGENDQLSPEYLYLQGRLKAIEKVIQKYFGTKGLESIKQLYEQEMSRRILEARDH